MGEIIRDQRLQGNLRDFGLDPRSWQIESLMKDDEHFLIRSKEDESFLLLGLLQRNLKQKSWKSVHLLSL